ISMERHGKKGKGQMKLYLPDGSLGGEKSFQHFLPGLDVSIYQAIFSFDLEGLQGLQQLQADELNDYLFHAGTTGQFSIRQLEKKLEKKQGELFLPKGQRPLLNAQLKQLEKLEQ